MLVCAHCGSTYTRAQEHCGLDGHPLRERSELPLVGRTIDRYRIEAPIGSGGMAMVYRAVHVGLEQSFAFKTLHGHMAADTVLAKRFQREAKVLSRLSHPNIVSVTDFGATEHGVPYMVMQYLDGESVWARVRREGPQPSHRAGAWLWQIASGLERAHKRGFIHRDLKPQNLMIVEDGDEEHIRILDFGLVGIIDREQDTHTQLTTEGMFFGTPAYMSPEQITGAPTGPASDLYALGVVAYLMLTGETPFSGDVRELAHHHVTTKPRRPPLDYGGLTPLVMRLLEKSPDDRPESARAVMSAIEDAGLMAPQRSRTQAIFDFTGPKEADSEPELVLNDTALDAPRPRPLAPPRSRSTPAAALFMLVGLAALVGVLWSRPHLIPERLRAALSLTLEPEASSPGAAAAPTPEVRGPASAALPPEPETPRRSAPVRTPEKPRDEVQEPPEDARASQAKFRALDEALGVELSRLGVEWASLEAADEDNALAWGRLYRDPSSATPAEAQALFEALVDAARAIPTGPELTEPPAQDPPAFPEEAPAPADVPVAEKPELEEALDRSMERLTTETSTEG